METFVEEQNYMCSNAETPLLPSELHLLLQGVDLIYSLIIKRHSNML